MSPLFSEQRRQLSFLTLSGIFISLIQHRLHLYQPTPRKITIPYFVNNILTDYWIILEISGEKSLNIRNHIILHYVLVISYSFSLFSYL